MSKTSYVSAGKLACWSLLDTDPDAYQSQNPILSYLGHAKDTHQISWFHKFLSNLLTERLTNEPKQVKTLPPSADVITLKHVLLNHQWTKEKPSNKPSTGSGLSSTCLSSRHTSSYIQTTSLANESVTVRLTQHIMGHFRDESFQPTTSLAVFEQWRHTTGMVKGGRGLSSHINVLLSFIHQQKVEIQNFTSYIWHNTKCKMILH